MLPPLLAMPIGSSGFGAGYFTFQVYLSTIVRVAGFHSLPIRWRSRYGAPVAGTSSLFPRMSSQKNLTSSVVTSTPSDHLMPLRR